MCTVNYSEHSHAVEGGSGGLRCIGTGMHSVVPYQMASVKSEVEGGPVDGEAGSV